MEDLLADVLGALFEIFGDFALQTLFGLSAEALGGLTKDPKQTSPEWSTIGPIVGGAAAGLLSAWLFPNRLIATRVVLPGVSLLLAPLATGSAMHLLGRRRRRLGQPSTSLATFRGGALFAFSMALVRWCLIGLSH